MTNDNNTTTTLRPTQYLTAPTQKQNGHVSEQQDENISRDDIALIILNSPIADFEYFHRLYSHASYTLCADGGADRLHNLITTTYPDLAPDVALRKALPNAIHGDLDSLSDSTRTAYTNLGVEISRDPDQYSTDFGKAVSKILALKPSLRSLLVLGSVGGRVDQGIGLLHELYREQKFRHPDVKFWLFSEASVSVVLGPGKTVLHLPVGEGLVTRNVGILPVYGRAVVSTRGLEWDVEGWETEMGGMVSSSNHVVEDVVEIESDREVLFTVERAVGR
jgi:thiamine pyrophosphokinase